MSPPLGQILVEALPPMLTDVGLTSRSEKLLDGIVEGRVPLPVFEAKMVETLRKLVDPARAAKLAPPPFGCEAKLQAADKPGPKDAKLCPQCSKGTWFRKPRTPAVRRSWSARSGRRAITRGGRNRFVRVGGRDNTRRTCCHHLKHLITTTAR